MSRMNSCYERFNHCFMQMILQYLPKRDLFEFICINKKCQQALKETKVNDTMFIEPSVKRSLVTKIPLIKLKKRDIFVPSAYKMYENLETFKVFSYDDLLNVYKRVLVKRKKEIKENVMLMIEYPDKYSYIESWKEEEELKTVNRCLEGSIPERIETVFKTLNKLRSKMDRNGVTLEMVIEEYKRYFPKLSDVKICLRMTKNPKYDLISDFIGLYSMKNRWYRYLCFYHQMNKRLIGCENQNLMDRIEPNNVLEPEQDSDDSELEGLEGFNNVLGIVIEDDEEEESVEETESELVSEEGEEEQEMSEDEKEVRYVKEELRRTMERDDYCIPKGVEILPNNGFEFCLVESVVLPEGIQCLGNWCFKDCRHLSIISIPNSVRYFGKGCFMRCEELITIEMDLECKLREIGDQCFLGCKKLEIFDLPTNVKELGEESFLGCERLDHVRLNEQIKVIKKWTFKDCNRLYYVELPKGIKMKGDPFDNTPYKLVKLMERMRNQGKYLLTN